MQEQRYEFFKREFEFTGKHARMAGELWIQNDIQNSYFKRLIDLYLLAPIIGFRFDHKAESDYSFSDTKSIFVDQILRERDKLEFIMQMIRMLEPAKEEAEARVNQAFREPRTKQEFDVENTLFHNYVRGGVEILYERLIVRTPELDVKYKEEKSANLMALFEWFQERNQ